MTGKSYMENEQNKTQSDSQGRPAASKAALLRQIFLSMLMISGFTFGGGFVIVSLMKKKFVDELRWIDEPEMLDLVALAQSSPGSIAVNAAILVGWRVCGTAGMAVAVLGTIIPPLVILSVISLIYEAFASNRYVALFLKGMQAGVAAVIIDVVAGLGSKVLREKSPLHIGMMAAAFIAVFFFKVNVIHVILAALALGVALAFIRKKENFVS